MENTKYKLLDKNGVEYNFLVPAKLGGHRKLKIYGKLHCSSALMHIDKGNYEEHRVFLADKETAIMLDTDLVVFVCEKKTKSGKMGKIQIIDRFFGILNIRKMDVLENR